MAVISAVSGPIMRAMSGAAEGSECAFRVTIT